ncbi:TonB-dependent receptor [Sphingomonas chungangi]|uniref:TonB-dependent receptor n=1 Tax=Sphingomonas chungangi TaxID=2683589 RepID=UPI0013661D6B|nr:TonB-dependent receptor [Sphingomonas chungangi]
MTSKAILSTSVAIMGLAVAQPAWADDATSTAPGPTIVVTGIRQQSSEVKRNASNVIDIRSGEQIRALPDANAAEALQRIPGVSLETDTGEGRFVNIRGMDADLNGTSYDGVHLTASNPSSPQGGSRAVALDAFPSGILGGIEVIKSLNPEYDAEGLGGLVNILPRDIAANQSLLIEGSGGLGDETLHGTLRERGDITVGGGFGQTGNEHRLSVVLSYAYDRDKRNIDDVEADYINDPTVVPAGTSAFLASKAFDDVQPRRYIYQRTRQGLSGGIVFRPDENTRLYVRGLDTGYVERANKHEFVLKNLADNIVSVDNATGDITSSGVELDQKAISTKEIVHNDLIEGGGETSFGGIKLDGKVAYTKGRDRFPYSYSTTFADKGVTAVYNNTNADVPVFHTADGTDITDPSNFSSFKGDNGPSANSDSEFSAIANLTVPLGEDIGAIKIGGNLRQRARHASAAAADLSVPDGATYADYASSGNDIFYGGAYNIGSKPDYHAIEGLTQDTLVDDPTAFAHDSEDVYGGYAQYTGTFGNLTLVGGVRVEATRATYRANAIDEAGNVTLNANHTSYTNVFPALNLRYRLNDQLQVRAAFSTAIGRPGFQQISAARSYDTVNDVVSQGNPSLKPTYGKNLDATIEYYFSKDSFLSVGVFYKWFNNYIISTTQRGVTYTGGPFTDTVVELDSFSNIGAAHAYGLEAQVHERFAFLPQPLDGFGFDGNVTLVGSHGEIRQGETHTLPQTSPINFNASLFYESPRFKAEVASTYVSRNLWAVGDSDATDLYSQPRFRLDASIDFAVTPRVHVFAEAKNLTNTKLEFTQTSSRQYPVQREYYDRDFLGGVRINFDR